MQETASFSSGCTPNSNANTLGQSSAASSFTEANALEKIHQFAKENSELRSVLKENNEVMKRQHDTLLKWKEKILAVNKVNKEQFDESHKLIVMRGQEVENLQKHVKTLEADQNQLNQDKILLEQKVEELQVMNEKLKNEILLAEEETMQISSKLKKLQTEVMEAPEQQMQTGLVSKLEELEEDEKSQQIQNELTQKSQELLMVNDANTSYQNELKRFKEHADQLMIDLLNVTTLKSKLQMQNAELTEENIKLKQNFQRAFADNFSKRILEEHPSDEQITEARSVSVHGAAAPVERKTSDLKTELPVIVEEQVQKLEEKLAQQAKLSIKMQQESDADRQTSISDILKQLNQEKSKVSHLTSRITEMNELIARLQAELHNKSKHSNKLNEEHQSKLKELTDQLDKLRNIKKDQQPVSFTNDVQSLRSQVINLISEVQESQIKLRASTDALDKKHTRCIELESLVSRLQLELQRQRTQDNDLVKSLECALKHYEEMLQKERLQQEITKKQLLSLSESFTQLVADYKEVFNSCECYKAQLDDVLKKNDQLMAQVLAAKETIDYKNAKIEEQKLRLNQYKKEIENIPILKAQAEVFKADFDAERMARELQHSEKQKLLEDMQNLQLLNKQLLDELETMSHYQLVEMQRRHAPTKTSYQHFQDSSVMEHDLANDENNFHPNNDEPGAGEATYLSASSPMSQSSQPGQHDEGEYQLIVCPLCEMTFPDQDSVTVHINDCLDRNAQLPSPDSA